MELVGRKRLSGSVISEIAREKFDSFSKDGQVDKQEMLRWAIRKSVEIHHDRMYKRLLTACRQRVGKVVFPFIDLLWKM
jgi:hypothetical protein